RQRAKARARPVEQIIDGQLAADEGINALGGRAPLARVEPAMLAQSALERAICRRAVASHQPVRLEASLGDTIFPQRTSNAHRSPKRWCMRPGARLDRAGAEPLLTRHQPPKVAEGVMLVGHKAPDFSLEAMVGKGDFAKVSLSDFQGKWVVLFFYSLDFTTVCPTEIMEFSRREAEFKRLNAAILGCSIDSVYAHRAW